MARIGVAVIGAGLHGRGARRGAAARGVRGGGRPGRLGRRVHEVRRGDRRAEGVSLAEGAARRQGRRVGAHRHAEQAALRDGEGGARGRQARAVREAAGHELEGVGRAGGPRPEAPEAGRRRQLQHPLLPALASRRASGCAAGSSARSTTCPAATCRTGCSSTPTTTGGSWPPRAASCGRWPTSARTGWTSSTRSPASRSRPSAPTSSPSTRCAAGPRARWRRSAASSARKSDLEPVDITTEDYGGHPAALRGRGAGHARGLAGDRGPEELPALRDGGGEGRPRLEQREPQGALDRPPRRAERAADARPVDPLGARARGGWRSRRPRRGLRRHLQAALPGLLRLHREGRLLGAAAVSPRSRTATARWCCAKRSSRATARAAG